MKSERGEANTTFGHAGGAGKSWSARYRIWSDRNYDYCEPRLTQMAIFNPFWRRVFNFFWMPFAYHSGIRLVARQPLANL